MKISPLSRWIEPDTTQPIPSDFIEGLHGSELLARALMNRGIVSLDQARGFLDPAHYQPANPYDLPDMDKAVKRLQTALRNRECIGVWGDFDVDGQTATSLLVGVLRGLGAQVKYHIPIRAQESHGVNLPVLIRFLEQGVDMVLTCDTGISAHESADYTREHGIDLIITDHHTLPDQLPDAFAVVNPQRLPEDHPLRSLAGVGVAYQVAYALCEQEGQGPLAMQQLDLVALGCVADVASLKGDVRYLVQMGLKQLREPQRVGLRALYERADLNPAQLTEQHIGFIIAPRLNAIGRLSDANPVVEFLTTSDSAAASVFAAQLEGFNSERRFMTEQVFQGSLSLIEREPSLLSSPVLILAHPEWPAGVIGIVASRLVELFNRPAILLSSPPGEPARGSARSIEGINITAAIASGADLLLGYGGHPMAAGMALNPENLPEFRQRVAAHVRQQSTGLDLTPSIPIDAEIKLQDLTLDTVAEIERLAPFGAGNPPIILAARFVKAIDTASIGKSGEHLQIVIEDESGNTRRVLWWQGVREWIPEGRFDLAFTARSSNYRGSVEVQLEWVDARILETPEDEKVAQKSHLQILDFRNTAYPLHQLDSLRADAECVVWREGKSDEAPEGYLRSHLMPADTLVVWNPPPGRAELIQALTRVNPATVALFAVPAGKDDPQTFLTTLSGLVRHALRNRAGEISISQLAGILNQRETTINASIRWLIARGFVRLLESDGEKITLAENGVPDMKAVPELEKRIQELLEETAAFRAFYLRTDPSELLSV